MPGKRLLPHRALPLPGDAARAHGTASAVSSSNAHLPAGFVYRLTSPPEQLRTELFKLPPGQYRFHRLSTLPGRAEPQRHRLAGGQLDLHRALSLEARVCQTCMVQTLSATTWQVSRSAVSQCRALEIWPASAHLGALCNALELTPQRHGGGTFASLQHCCTLSALKRQRSTVCWLLTLKPICFSSQSTMTSSKSSPPAFRLHAAVCWVAGRHSKTSLSSAAAAPSG